MVSALHCDGRVEFTQVRLPLPVPPPQGPKHVSV
jgi:hypothetical protein